MKKLFLLSALCSLLLPAVAQDDFSSAQTFAPRNGLVGHWTFNSTNAGQFFDSSGFANTTATATAITNGVIGAAMNNAGSAAVTVSSASGTSLAFAKSNFTVSAWCYYNGNSSSYWCIIQNGAAGYTFCVDAINGRMIFGQSGNLNFTATTNVLSAGIYMLTGRVSNGTNYSIFVNGVTNNSANVTSIPTSGNTLYLGVSSFGADVWRSWIDDVRIYNRALSAEEIRQMVYTNANGAFPRLAYPTGKPMTDQDCALAYSNLNSTNYLAWKGWK